MYQVSNVNVSSERQQLERCSSYAKLLQ